jgi:hypothetical protein
LLVVEGRHSPRRLWRKRNKGSFHKTPNLNPQCNRSY